MTELEFSFEEMKKESKFLVKPFILPFSIIAVGLIILSLFIVKQSYWSTFQGLFLNLGATIIGIIITVVYVNYVLSKQEKQKWNGVSTNINNRIKSCLINIIGLFYGNFELNITSMNLNDVLKIIMAPIDNDPESFKDIINIGKKIEKTPKLKDIDQKRLDHLFKSISHLQDKLLNLIQLFGDKIEPPILQDLLELEEKLKWFTNFYPTFFSLFLSNKRTFKTMEKELDNEFYDTLEPMLRRILSLTLELMEKMK